MSASRNSFGKFTLKPSSLSQHTVNFNKILEQVPVPKIDPLELVKPLDANGQDSTLNTEKENTQASTEPSREFVFGEKLTDRVINVVSENESKNEDETASSQHSNKNSQPDNEKNQAESKATLWNNNFNENEADQIENNDANTLLRLNCKLFMLETDKAKWLERGYGVLKLIDSNDGINCKIMMWTDKTFRMILNTKMFEKMQIDRANTKSIRFNAIDNGAIRIFLVKTANSNDCDELYSKLQMRFNEYITQLETCKQSESKSEVSSSSQSSANEKKSQKDIVFQCLCEYNSDGVSSTYIPSKIHLYNYTSSSTSVSSTENMPTSNSHQLLLDIVDVNKESTVLLSTYLKLIKTKKQQKTDVLEFEINESFLLPPPSSSKTSYSSKLNYKVMIHDEESMTKFLSYYDKEPKFHVSPDESSNDASEFNNSDNSNENSSQDNDDYIPIRKSDSTYENTKDEEEKAEQTDEKVCETNKKRKNESSQEICSKSMKKSDSDLSNENESNTNEPDLKRNQSDDESSKELNNDHVFKKSKVTEETKDQQD